VVEQGGAVVEQGGVGAVQVTQDFYVRTYFAEVEEEPEEDGEEEEEEEEEEVTVVRQRMMSVFGTRIM
jgi:phage terminase Nu1 subunit (DNA packaging protein)